MATSPPLPSPFLSAAAAASATINSLAHSRLSLPPTRPRPNFRINAAKVPAGVELPKEQPKLVPPVVGFTRTAEIWNSRTCMIGLVGIFIVELILNKGVLQIVGLEVGRGLNLPL